MSVSFTIDIEQNMVLCDRCEVKYDLPADFEELIDHVKVHGETVAVIYTSEKSKNEVE